MHVKVHVLLLNPAMSGMLKSPLRLHNVKWRFASHRIGSLRNIYRFPVRGYSSAPPVKKPVGLKALMKEYGYSALGIYFGLSMIDLPLCYILVHSFGKEEIERYENDAKQYFGYGIDPEELRRQQQARLERSGSTEADTLGAWGILSQFSWTEFALAYGIHKSLIFIRLPICAAITPLIVHLLRRWGFRIGSTNLSTSALLAKDKIQDFSASSAQFGTRPSTKKKWFSWFF